MSLKQNKQTVVRSLNLAFNDKQPEAVTQYVSPPIQHNPLFLTARGIVSS